MGLIPAVGIVFALTIVTGCVAVVVHDLLEAWWKQ